MPASKEEVAAFLKKFKKFAKEAGMYFIDRQVNNTALTSLGLTKNDAKQEIMTLSVTNYCKGPEPDHNEPGDIWVFGKK